MSRPESTRLRALAAFLDAHVELDAPDVYGDTLAWSVTGRPGSEATVLALVDNWKVTFKGLGFNWISLTGYHESLGQLQVHVDRWASLGVERDFAEFGGAVAVGHG